MTWAEQWTLWERQPNQVPDAPCSDALVYSNKTGAMYFGHPGEEIDGPDAGTRSNYTILRSLDQGASWQFLEVIFPSSSGGSGYSDMHLLDSPAAEAGDLIGVAFQKGKEAHLARGEGSSMGWAVVRVPPPPSRRRGER